MKLIDADKLSADMYHEAFVKDSDMQKWDNGCWIRYKMFEDVLKAQPVVQPNTTTNDSIPAKTGKNDGDRTSGDCISRQQAIDALHMHLMYRMGTDSNKKRLDDWINGVPSVQPERTCVNCGKTVNNGGWYADGGTRCPIEEHYALPKDGFCHLWEKRNVTDDDYPERREE